MATTQGIQTALSSSKLSANVDERFENFVEENIDSIGVDGTWSTVTESYDNVDWNEDEIRPDVKEYVTYWKQKWNNHPLNRTDKNMAKDLEIRYVAETKMDWERFVTIADLIFKWAQKKRMVSSKPPRHHPSTTFFNKHGEPVTILKPYFTFYEGDSKDRKEHEILTENLSLTDYDVRTHYRFTIGNYEAALKITKPVWKPRLKRGKKGKFNWRYVISPICYEFLVGLQQELNGYAQEFMDKFNALKYQKPVESAQHVTNAVSASVSVEDMVMDKNTHIEVMMEEATGIEHSVNKTAKELIDLGCSIHGMREEPVYEDMEVNYLELDAPQTEMMEELTIHESEAILPEELVSEESETEVCVHSTDSETTEERKKQPRGKRTIKSLVHRRKDPFRWYPLAPIYSSFEENLKREDEDSQSWMKGCYFRDLEMVMLRIGRPDIVAGMRAGTRIVWLRKKVLSRYGRHGKALEQRRIHLRFCNGEQTRENILRAQANRGHELPEIRSVWNSDNVEPQMMCVPFQRYRDRLRRILSQNLVFMHRHRDKMEVLSHRGRFAYMTTWDMALFERQKKKILELPRAEYQIFLSSVGTEVKDPFVVPFSYVEEADYVAEKITKCIKEGGLELECKVAIMMKEFCERWVNREFKVADTHCLRPQAGETPLQSSGGASGSGGTDPVSAPIQDAPITSGKKEVTMTTIDQRVADVDKVEVFKADKSTKETRQEDPYIMPDIVKRPMMIDRFVWGINDQRFKELRSWVVPHVYFSAQGSTPTVCQNLNAAYLLAMFGSAKFDLKVKVQLNSVKFQQGKLLAFFKPFSDDGIDEGDIPNNYMQFPHVMLDASESNPGEMIIPFTNFRDAFPIYSDPHNEYNYFGQFKIIVWNPLKTGQNSSSDISVIVYMNLENFEPRQICNPKDPGKVVFASELRKIPDALHIKGNKGPQLVRLQEGIKLSTVAALIQPQMMESLINTGVGIAIDKGPALLEQLLQNVSRGPNSKPGNPSPPAPVCPQVMHNGAYGEGVDLCNRLSLSPLEITRPPSDKTTKAGFRDLMNQWSRIKTMTWSTDDEESKPLHSWPVTPLAPSTDFGIFSRYASLHYTKIASDATDKCDVVPGYGGGIEYVRQPSMLEYLAKAFYYWHGSLKYRLEVVCTNMHSGRLLIRYEPYGTVDSAKLECQKIATPGLIWDVQEQHTLDFEAPYMSTQPFLLTQFYSDSSPLNALYAAINGLCEVIVINRLKVTTGVSSLVEINLYVCAGDDFEFAVPSPLHGIAKLRLYDVFDQSIPQGPIGSATWLQYVNLLYAYLQYPLNKSGETTDWKKQITAKDGSKWWVPNRGNTSPLWNGPGMELMGKFGAKWSWNSDDYTQSVLDALKQAKASTTFKGVSIPFCKTVKEAWSIIGKIPDGVYPTDFADFYKAQGIVIDRSMVQRLRYWLAVALLRHRAIVLIRFYPADPADKPTLVAPSSATMWSPQGKDTPQSEYVNPFKGYAPKIPACKEIMGESFMDMYKILKRYHMWSSLTLPTPYDSTNSVDPGCQYDKDFHGTLSALNSWERSQYMLEFVIPVTPYQYFHGIGCEGHAFVEGFAQGSSRIMGNTLLAFEEGGGEIGSVCSLTYLRYFAELFSFWKGSMRYRFTLSEPWVNGKPQTMYVCHHPRTYHSWDEMCGSPRIVHMKRMRDMSKFGMQMLSGNVMGSLDIEVPYYSQYSKLQLSQSCDETSTTGSLLLYVPLDVVSPPDCTGKKDIIIRGCPVQVWTAVGDDFEFIFPRSAPQVRLYPGYYNDVITNYPWDKGYDRSVTPELERNDKAGYAAQTGAYLGVMKEMNDDNAFGHQLTHPFPSAVEYMTAPFIQSRTATIKTKNNIDEITTFKIFDEKFTTSSDKPTQWEPQMNEVAEVTEPEASTSETSTQVEAEDPVFDDVDGVLEAAGRAVLKLPSIISSVEDTIVRFNTTANSVGEAVCKLTGIVSDVKTEISIGVHKQVEAAEEVKTTAGTMGKVTEWALTGTRIVLFYNGILSLLEAETWSDRWVPIAQCALALGLAPEMVMKAGEWMIASVSSLFSTTKGNDVLQPQGYETKWDSSWTAFVEEHADLFKFVAAGVFTIVTFYMTSDCPIANNVSSFAVSMLRKLKNFAIVGTALKTLDWMWRWVADLIKSSLTWVGDLFSGGSITAMRMSTHYPQVVSWLKAVEYYKLDATLLDLCWNADERLKLWKLMDEGEELMSKLSSKFGHLHGTLMRGMTILQNAHNKAVISRNISPIREDPFHICLVGSPGVGKSAILTFIMNFIADEAGLPKKHRIYPRAEEDEYWTNYTGQPVVVIDDLYADKKATAIKELVKMKSNLAWPLNMADLPEKGRGFMSKLIGSTTNHPYPEHPDITCKGAVWRRRDILLNVRRVTPREHGSSKVRWDDLQFDIMDANNETGPKLREGMSLEDVLVVGTRAFLRHSMTQKALVMAGLQGKSIEIADYGDDEEEEVTEVVSMSAMMMDMVKRKVKISEDFYMTWLQTVSVNDFMALYEIPEVKDKLDQSKAVREYMSLKMREMHARKFHKIVVAGKKEEYQTMWIMAVSMGLYQKTLSVNGDLVYYCPIGDINVGDTHREWGMLVCVKEKEDEDFQVFTPNGGDDDLSIEFDDDLTRRAQENIRQTQLIQSSCEALVASICSRPKTRSVKFVDDDEVQNTINQLFPEFSKDMKAKLRKDIKEIYASIQRSKPGEREQQRINDEAFGKLFQKEYAQFWKEKDGHWHMEFNEDALDDATFELFETWSLIKERWDQKDIDEMKTQLPSKEAPLVGYVNTVKRYLDGKKKSAEKWFEDHPYVYKVMKALGLAAGLFAGYKMMQYLCPGVVEKIKNFVAGIFGWSKKKIGEERVDSVIATGKRLGKNARDTVLARFAAVKAWMLNSGDPALVESATDDESVVLFAEMMEKSLQNGRNGLVLAGKIAEARTRPLNPYVVSDGNFKAKPEHKAILKGNEHIISPQGSEDPNAEDLRRNKIVPNMVYVSRIRAETNSVLSMTGLFIGKSDLLLPYHFFVGCKDNTRISITTTNGASFFDVYMAERCIKIPDQDAVVFRCGPRVGLFRSLVSNFMTNDDLARYTQISATLSVLTPEGSIIVQPVAAFQEHEITYHEGKNPIKNAVMWSYEASTQVGDCGAVLVAHNSAIQRKILGIHVAGVQRQNYGGSTVITQEMLTAIIEALPVVTLQKVSDGVPPNLITKGVTEMKVAPKGNFTLLGAVPMCKEVRLPHKTEIEPSAIHDMVRKHVTEPAVLQRSDPRNESGESPLLKALEKYGKPTLPFDPIDLDYITADLMAEVKTWKAPMGKRKLTDWEAVFGNETIEYCDRMNLSASPGYPYTLSRPSGEKGKAYLYDAAATNGIRDKTYLAEYERREKLAKQGIRKDSIWTDCLKDERRPLEKIKTGKTRAFMLPPADYVQLSRKYLMAFCVAFYTNHIKSFSAVGLDPYSYDWTRLVRKLKRKSAYGFGGDFHSFDGIFDPDIMWRIGKIIDNWYKHNHSEDWEETDTIVREVLFQELIHTVHICLNSIYMKHQGNPSGNPLTVVVNTFAHCFYIRLAWLGLSRKCGEDASLHLMHRLVAEIYYGDDGLAAIPLGCESWFNLKTVSEFLWQYGIEYTSESKDENLYGVRKLTQCTFLKNGMKRMQGMNIWLAPIAEDTIYELTNWVRKSDDPIAQLRENLENALKFAFHHGREFYDSLLMRINNALEEKGLLEMSITFEIQERNFLQRCVA